MKLNPLHAVFFDLDGTLLDTAPDLFFALNQTLHAYERDPVIYPEFRHHVNSTHAILQFGFHMEENHSLYPEIQQKFLSNYQDNLTRHTQLFPGMKEVLNYLDQQFIPWGIVTSKPLWLTAPLLQHFELTHRLRCLVTADTLPFRKPDPEPLLHACQLVNVAPEKTVYIGDNLVDMVAAKAAGLFAMGVAYGYHSNSLSPEHWDTDLLISNAFEIIDWLKLQNTAHLISRSSESEG